MPVKKCRKCGRTEDETKFYPSVNSECADCQRKRQQISRNKEGKTWHPMPEGEEAATAKTQVEVGKTLPSVEKTDKTITLDFSPHPWALAWLREEHDGDQNAALELVREVASKVPAEWLKNHMMERKL